MNFNESLAEVRRFAKVDRRERIIAFLNHDGLVRNSSHSQIWALQHLLDLGYCIICPLSFSRK